MIGYELLKSGAIKGQAAAYIAGRTHDFKVMLFRIGFKPEPLSGQYVYIVRATMSYAAIYPSPFLVHHLSSVQKLFIFQAIST